MNILYIIGNGFDLNIGLRTSYKDFYNYYNSLETTIDKIKFLKESIEKNYETWSDLEIGLGAFTDQLNSREEFLEVFEDISDRLAEYLENEENSFDFSLIDKKKFFADLCFPEKYLPLADSNKIAAHKNIKGSEHWHVGIITLNYTRSIEKIIDAENLEIHIGVHHKVYQIILRTIEHLHGYFDERMIMGVDNISQIKNERFHQEQEILEAVVKPTCNAASKAIVDLNCEKLIQNADLICIFGSSLGETDNTWWKLISDQLLSGASLIIFTRGDEINKRRPYKTLPVERQLKKIFLDKSTLSDEEKVRVSNKIYIAINSQMFSHMRTNI